MNIFENSFDRSIGLQYLNISYNPLRSLKIKTFARLEHLGQLILRKAKLSEIRLSTFRHLYNLELLNLSENKLKVFNFNLFKPINRNLYTLCLGSNQITNLIGFQHKILPQLTSLDIQKNEFNCSYLEQFMNSVNFEEKLVNLSKSHFNEVNCNQVKAEQSTYDERNITSKGNHLVPPSGDKFNKLNGRLSGNIYNNYYISHHYYSDDLISKLSSVFMCFVISTFCILFIAINRDRIYNLLRSISFTHKEEAENSQYIVEYINEGPLLI